MHNSFLMGKHFKHNSSIRALLEIGRINIWEWNLQTDKIIDFGCYDSLAHRCGVQSGGTIASFQSKVHPDDRKEVMSRVERALSSPHSPDYECEYRIMMLNGSYEWVHSRARVYFDENKVAERVLGIWMPCKENKKFLLDQHKEQILFAEDIRSSSLAEISSRLAHEIAQPLSAASTYLEGSIQRLKNFLIGKNELLQVIEDALSQISTVGAVVHRIRDFVCRRNLCKERSSLSAVVNNVIHAIQKGFPVEIAMHLSGDVLDDNVDFDQFQIRQVLLNLLNNCCEALIDSQHPAPEIKISIEERKTHVVVKISDNGPGFPASILSSLFVPFCTTKPKGMGIGLATCKTIIDAHGGTIGAYNPPGGGAEVVFTLPFVTVITNRVLIDESHHLYR